MTFEAQRIAIAKASKGKIFCDTDDPTWWFESCGQTCPCFDNDPLSDLNAMHEAEKVLTHDQKNAYVFELSGKCGTRGCRLATAAQRAEAFLRTLNLWDDTK